ncbi:MAG TPA: HAD-IC family P-type ATPase, partial [Burkholderiaceae bacterium]|nr:HAD-IC family P-type ATPase [Burkholderiaceae bacterium]
EAHAATVQSWSEVNEVPGSGIQAVDAQGRGWRLGSAAWTGAPAGGGQTEVCLACDGRALARFVFDEQLRDDAVAAVQALQADGVQVGLLSGDAAGRVQQLAGALGIGTAAGALQPADKLAAVRAAQQRGEVVAMLGDGVNDAPVLAQADVSLAMGEGALLARTQADAILISNRLSDVAQARTLARRALRVVHQNLLWAAVYNAACVPLALVGWLPPWAAGLGMATSSLLVVLNSMRLSHTATQAP